MDEIQIRKGLMQDNNRNLERVNLNLPIHLSFGTQITLVGQTKDLSVKSAFVNVRSSIHMTVNDELTFNIVNVVNKVDCSVQGSARISRVAAGEGIAIYFTKLDETALTRLEQLISVTR